MQNLSLFKSAFLLVTAVVVSYFFTTPQVSQIRANQDQKVLFDNEINRVANVNQVLSQYQSTIASIPIADRQKLLRFLPSEVDELVFLRDIEFLFGIYNIVPRVLSIGSEEEISQTNQFIVDETAEDIISTRELKVSFEASYENIKNILLFSEQHPYLLEFRELRIAPVENVAALRVDATIVVYLYQSRYGAINNNDN